MNGQKVYCQYCRELIFGKEQPEWEKGKAYHRYHLPSKIKKHQFGIRTEPSERFTIVPRGVKLRDLQ